MGEENHGEAGANRRRTAISPGEEGEGKSESDDGVTAGAKVLFFAAKFYPSPLSARLGGTRKNMEGEERKTRN